jgi:DNA-binding protein
MEESQPVASQTEAPQENNSEQKKRIDDNIIFVGDKPLINYVRGISVQFSKQTGTNTDVIVRSRGKFISKAVDIVEIAKRKFFDKEGIRVKDIKISSEEFKRDGKDLHVSSMDIVLGK